MIRGRSVEAFEFDGLRVRDYTAGADSESSVAEIVCAIGAAHRHALSRRSTKYYFVLEGDVEFEIGGSPHALRPGDLAVVPRGTAFRYRCGRSAARMLLVHTPPFVLEDEVFLDE